MKKKSQIRIVDGKQRTKDFLKRLPKKVLTHQEKVLKEMKRQGVDVEKMYGNVLTTWKQ